MKWLLGIMLILGLVLTSCVSVTPPTSDVPLEELETFAKCLTDNGATMYGTSWCSHCQNQKAMFGDAFSYIDYVDCETDPSACRFAGVQGFPTWEIDGNLYPGEQPLEQLGELAECELNGANDK